MTRLTENDIADLDAAWLAYERQLCAVTGLDLFTLAARTIGMKPPCVTGLRVAAIPISSGEGCIPGFADSLASIARHLGFTAETVAPDEAGFQEARARFDLLIWADDDNYYAENVRTGTLAENGRATGQGFATALIHMANKGWSPPDTPRTALVLGAGPVGRAGAETLVRAGYEVFLCDFDLDKALHARSAHIRPCTPEDLPSLVPRIGALLDAAPTNRCFPRDLLTVDACVAAPCVPCLWDDALPPSVRVWHDPLQLGTAVMLLAAACDHAL